MIHRIGPRFDEIDAELAALTVLREKPSGTIRIAAGEHAADTILWPAAQTLTTDYPDISVEITIDNGLTDIVADRFDAGVRLGERVGKDMIAVQIGPNLRMAVVGSPDYFARHPKPRTPQDLTHHNCINIRLPTAGGLYAWEFEKAGRALKVRVEGQLVFNTATFAMKAALAGCGLACARGSRAGRHGQRATDQGSGSLVRAVRRVSPVLPEPATTRPGIRFVGRRLALPRTAKARSNGKAA